MKRALRWRGEGPWNASLTTWMGDVSGTAKIFAGDVFHDLTHTLQWILGLETKAFKDCSLSLAIDRRFTAYLVVELLAVDNKSGKLT